MCLWVVGVYKYWDIIKTDYCFDDFMFKTAAYTTRMICKLFINNVSTVEFHSFQSLNF